ncbi:MAG: hypothetical protein GY854_34540 [Deltaproteobacteria bacterium]|nr:hypothetical protein [Deltaproteobacteria bacterium]
MSQSEKDSIQLKTNTGEIKEQLDVIRTLESNLTDLKRRFVEASATANEALDEHGEPTFLLLTIADKSLALPISHVEEVAQMAALSELPKKPPGVLGLIDFHGDMLAVIDLSELIGTGRNSVSAQKALVICETELLKFAIMVDEATEVITVAPSSIQMSSEILPGALKVLGVLRYEERAALIIDIVSIMFAVQLDKIGDEASSETSGGENPEGNGA